MDEKASDAAWRDFLRLWPYLRRQSAWLAAAAAASLAFAATTSAYAWLVGPVLRFIYDPTAGAPGTRGIPDWGWAWLAAHRDDYPVLLGVMVVGLALVRGLAQFGHGACMGVIGQRVQAEIREEVYAKLLATSPLRLVRMEKGDLASRFVSDVVVLEYAITGGLSSLVGDSVQVALLVALALWLDPVMGAISLVILPFTTVLVVVLGRRIRQSQLGALGALGKISGSLVESARGLSVIKAFGAEALAARRFRDRNRVYYAKVMRAVVLGTLSSPLMELIAAAALAATLWYAKVRIVGGSLDPSSFVSFFAAVFLMYRPVKGLGGLSTLMNRGLAAARRVFGFLDEAEPGLPEGTAAAGPLAREVALEDVSYSYGGEDVLRGLTLRIPAGRTTALVGASGAGKTTVVSLLLRLAAPTAGRITWDGVPVEEVSIASLRSRIAVVPQDPFLFHDTVRTNIAIGAPGGEAGDEDVRRAISTAHAAAFVDRLPGGIDEVVGEEGGTLSGGERQRLCIARAAIRNADLVVLDEAASSLDAASEEAVRRGLEALAAGRTVLVIGHRLSTVRGADRIAVLEGGRIVEEGSYGDLARPGTAFHGLFAAQM